jgi:hypothetical protein
MGVGMEPTMSHPTNWAARRTARYTKGLRRLRVDRAEHGDYFGCACFDREARDGRGRVFARFADYPTLCSGWCCGNPRRWHGERTRQERRSDLD